MQVTVIRLQLSKIAGLTFIASCSYALMPSRRFSPYLFIFLPREVEDVCTAPKKPVWGAVSTFPADYFSTRYATTGVFRLI